MLLVYTPAVTPRLGYIFRHIFFRMLDVEISITSSIEKFVSHDGAKISYSEKPLGKELFFYSSKILFDSGIQDIEIEIFDWNNHPVFFKVPESSGIPFDIFAASFYLLSRYEEYLPHIKDHIGRYEYKNSVAFKNNFLEKPLVDIWVNELKVVINNKFNNLIRKNNSKKKILPIFEVSEPFKFLNKSIFSIIFQSLNSIYRFDLRTFFRQILVLINVKKDPFDEYQFIIDFFKKNQLNFISFFRYSRNSLDAAEVTILSKPYKLLIKNFSDHIYVGLLVSYFAQLNSNIFKKEYKNLKDLIHRKSFRVRLNNGIISLPTIYSDLVNQEVSEDYSMCYNNKIGFRASSSVPFYFYDLVNEVQTKLKVFPVFATEESIRIESNSKIFFNLKEIFSSLPLNNSIFSFAFKPSMFNKYRENYYLRSSFLEYLSNYGKHN